MTDYRLDPQNVLEHTKAATKEYGWLNHKDDAQMLETLTGAMSNTSRSKNKGGFGIR